MSSLFESTPNSHFVEIIIRNMQHYDLTGSQSVAVGNQEENLVSLNGIPFSEVHLARFGSSYQPVFLLDGLGKLGKLASG